MYQDPRANIATASVKTELAKTLKLSLHLTSEGWTTPATDPTPLPSYVPTHAALAPLAHVLWRPVVQGTPVMPDGPALADIYEQAPDAINEEYLRLRADASSQLFLKVASVIDAGLASDLSPFAIANAVGLRRASLARLVRENSGKSIAVFVRERRVAMALKMLRSTPERLGRIAKQCGFSSQSYFSQIIRAKTGVSPLDYRRRHLKQLFAGMQK
jgi:AraC-like DNA-binding protein